MRPQITSPSAPPAAQKVLGATKPKATPKRVKGAPDHLSGGVMPAAPRPVAKTYVPPTRSAPSSYVQAPKVMTATPAVGSPIVKVQPDPVVPTTEPLTKAAPPYGMPPVAPSDGVREMLNDSNWRLPAAPKRVKFDKDQLNMKAAENLTNFSYALNPQENKLIQDTYTSEAAGEWGYAEPHDAVPSQNMPVLKAEDTKAVPLTWEAYEAMSGDQRAAVDFNTLLVEAREKDLEKGIFLKDDEKQAYGERVDRIFGEGFGSARAAPNTLELLDKLNFEAVGQDLDQFLSLEQGISMEEIGAFEFSEQDQKTLTELVEAPAATAETAYAEVRAPENLGAVSTAAIQGAQDLIREQLSNPANPIWSFDTALGLEPAVAPPVGYGSGVFDQWARETYAQLETGMPVENVYASMNDNKFDDKDRNQFFSYMNNRTQLESQYGSPTPSDGTVTPEGLVPADEIRTILGLGD